MTSDDDERAHDERIRRDVQEHGCHIAIVPGSSPGTTFCAFTVGLWRNGHPEVVVFGLEQAAAEEILDLVQEEVDDGQRFAAGERRDGLLHQYPVTFGAVTPDKVAVFEPAVRFHGNADFPMLQLFWPDRQGRFPWDAGVQELCRRSQPLLAPRDGGNVPAGGGGA